MVSSTGIPGPKTSSADRYHNISHRSVDLVARPSGQGRRERERGSQVPGRSFPDAGTHRHVPATRGRPTVESYQNDPVVAEYFYQCEIARKERQGQLWRILAGPGTIFPNMSFLPRQPRSIAVWHPRGPDQTEVGDDYGRQKRAARGQGIPAPVLHRYFRPRRP